jgi:hypothetical protein
MSEMCRLCSLIPGFSVKLSAIILAGPTVLSAVGASPPHDGVRRRWWINVASAVSLIENSQKIGRSHHRHRPGRDIFSRCAAGTLRSRYCLLRGNLLLRPVELSLVDPHAVQNDRELARDGDCGLSEPIAFGEPHPPSLERRPFRHAGQQHASRFEKITAQHGVTTLRDASCPVDLAGSMASARQSDISPNTSGHGLGTRTSSTRCATRSWRRIGSRISGDRGPARPQSIQNDRAG